MLDFLRRGLRRRGQKKRIVVTAAVLTSFWVSAGVLFPSAPRRPEWADSAVGSAQRAEVVKDVFKFAWNGYYRNAFPNDELLPLWNMYSNSR
jgi:hypothetical protein